MLSTHAAAFQINDLAMQLVAHPYRALGNFIILWAYRNGEIENAHSGYATGYSLAHRRFTSTQERTIIREVANKLSGIITGPQLWQPESQSLGEWPNNVAALTGGPPFYYPANWTFDQASPQFELHRQDKFP